MPAKTSTKKPTPKQQSPEELRASLTAKQTDLLDYKRSLAAGELANPRIVGATRKDIARLKTALTAAEQTGKGEK
jgi:ribosomal protein L29